MKTGKKINRIIHAMALYVFIVPAVIAAEGATIEKAWELFNKERHTESLAMCEKLLTQYAADPEKTPAILRLVSLNYDHAAAKSGKADDELNAKAAMERITKDYPASSSAAEAYFYLGEFYSGNVPVKIETDCDKALSMYDKAMEKTGDKWIKEESYKGIERCSKKAAKSVAEKAAGAGAPAETAEAPYAGLVPGYRGTAIPVPGAQLLYVKKGDRVDVLVTFEAATKEAKEKVTATILQNVIVINTRKPERPGEKGVIELLCKPNEAQYLALSAAQGDTSIAVRAPGDVSIRPMEMASFRKLIK